MKSVPFFLTLTTEESQTGVLKHDSLCRLYSHHKMQEIRNSCFGSEKRNIILRPTKTGKPRVLQYNSNVFSPETNVASFLHADEVILK